MGELRKYDELWVGLDIGSTTAKIAIVDPISKELLDFKYCKHDTRQLATAKELLDEFHNKYSGVSFKLIVCGSGGKIVSKKLHSFFVQEVIANTFFIKHKFPSIKTAIELGGQDAKLIFFNHDDSGKIISSDMRMNGSCAGGTGAFIEEVASLLNIKLEDFNKHAAAGKNIFPISGRCGVFAKTDIQPLLNQGVNSNDIALSSLHALAKQTIGGLAQGMVISAPVIFEGGPFHFIPTLIDVFKEKLDLSDTDAIHPKHAEVVVAYGAALGIDILFKDEISLYSKLILDNLDLTITKEEVREPKLFFKSEKEKNDFRKFHKIPEFKSKISSGETKAYLGVDAGSTTTKFILLNEQEDVIYKFYTTNDGVPLEVLKKGLTKLAADFKKKGGTLNILGVGSTGYGGDLVQKGISADLSAVETVAHARAALKYQPKASFILDVGGQDMKAITIANGTITSIILNEACSAGCGSFLATFAKSLKVSVEDIADLAFESKSPARLGSRCTVFMNSSVITEQKEGKKTGDILAGLCQSVVENIFTKVVRVPNFSVLGKYVVVQGGTFLNDAVLRAFEVYTGTNVIRPIHSGEMGAIGVALLVKEKLKEKQKSSFIGFDALSKFKYATRTGEICNFCTNHCNRTIVEFSNGESFVTGNKCERGLIIESIKDPLSTAKQIRAINEKMKLTPNLVEEREKLFFKNYSGELLSSKKNIRIGIPKVLQFWRSFPFWNALFSSLGFEVVLSSGNTQGSYEKGLFTIPSDTVCFPAKLVHGQIFDLEKQNVDRIFMPIVSKDVSNIKGLRINESCAVLQGYPITIKENVLSAFEKEIIFDYPMFNWFDEVSKKKQLIDYFANTFNISSKEIKKAIILANKYKENILKTFQERGAEVLKMVKDQKRKAVVLAARPYQYDASVNHNIAKKFIMYGVPVFTIDSLFVDTHPDLSLVRLDLVNESQAELCNTALFVAENPNLELVQIVSFGCGHDAIISDEIVRILNEVANKQPLIVKLDESSVSGPLNIRIKSFVETTNRFLKPTGKLNDPYKVKFNKKDRKKKTILIPTLNDSFSHFASAILNANGYLAKPLEAATHRAVELGKQYVHNDICFPAQINVGELLVALESGTFDPKDVAFMLSKRCTDCREVNYTVIARKALDDAGYHDIPLTTSTDTDVKNIHPGYNFNLLLQQKLLWALAISDILELLIRKIRPYELHKGDAKKVYDIYLKKLTFLMGKRVFVILKVLKECILAFNEVPIDISTRKPRVCVTGEILLHAHPTASFGTETYLEEHGMEINPASLFDVVWMKVSEKLEHKKNFHVKYPFFQGLYHDIQDISFRHIYKKLEKIMSTFVLYEPRHDIRDQAKTVDGIFDPSFIAGEGWLILAEILENARKGVRSVVILQPFGCLPNHIAGRGVTKKIKELYPDMQVLSLDFDPDVSFANIENRLQMLIINAKHQSRK